MLARASRGDNCEPPIGGICLGLRGPRLAPHAGAAPRLLDGPLRGGLRAGAPAIRPRKALAASSRARAPGSLRAS